MQVTLFIGIISMFNAEDDVIPKLEASCTKEVAVAKMLGWLQGTIRKRVIDVSEHGISADQMPHLLQLQGSLEEHLLELRNNASAKFIKAAEDEAPLDIIEEKEKAVFECDNLINLAAIYLQDITEELAKGDGFLLNIDQEATKKSGTTYITLNSLKVWALKKYGIAIGPSVSSLPANNDLQEQFKAQQKEIESGQAAGLSKTKADNLYTTFAFIVEALVQKTQNYKNTDSGKLNIQTIAENIASAAKQANNGYDLTGQSAESIKSRIEESMRIKKSKLPSK